MMTNVVIAMLLIGQGCNNGKLNNEGKIDSLNMQEEADTVLHISSGIKLNIDTVDGIWYIFKRFSDVSYSDTIFNPTTHLVIENNLISKLIDTKLIFIDSITNTENTNSFKKYQLKKREKDFFKYSKKYDEIRLFIGGEDGIREIYKRRDK